MCTYENVEEYLGKKTTTFFPDFCTSVLNGILKACQPEWVILCLTLTQSHPLYIPFFCLCF